MLLRLVIIVMLVAQPLPVRMCNSGTRSSACPTKAAAKKSCKHTCPRAATPRCCKATCSRALPVSPCAFCRNVPREPASPPSNPRPVNEQPVVLPMELAAAIDAGYAGLITAWSDLVPLRGEFSNSFRQASLCVWLI